MNEARILVGEWKTNKDIINTIYMFSSQFPLNQMMHNTTKNKDQISSS